MAAATRLPALGALTAVLGLIRLAVGIWAIVLVSRLVAAIERASNAYSESIRSRASNEAHAAPKP